MRSSLKQRLDKIIRDRLREQEPTCYTCGLPPSDVSHLLGKGAFPAIRWDGRNVHMQCRECHMKHHNGSQAYLDTFIRLNGRSVYGALRRSGRGRVGRQEMLALLDQLTL